MQKGMRKPVMVTKEDVSESLSTNFHLPGNEKEEMLHMMSTFLSALKTD